MTGTLIKAKLPPSTHEFADIIQRLEAGGSMLPDTPENLMQIIGIYKAYAVPMDFYWRDLLYIAERVFLDPLPFLNIFCPKNTWTYKIITLAIMPIYASGAARVLLTLNC
jgi:hypothetical protein